MVEKNPVYRHFETDQRNLCSQFKGFRRRFIELGIAACGLCSSREPAQ
jgi:hypothetical protein